MAWGRRRRRSLKVGGVRVNYGKRGITSVSAGGRAGRVNLGKRGPRISTGIPGSGVRYEGRVGGKGRIRTSGRGCFGCTSVLVAAVALVSASLLSGAVSSQGDEDLEATLAALQTEVAAVETAIAERDAGEEGTTVPIQDGPDTLLGTARFPEGAPREVSVVAVGPYATEGSRSLPVVLHNNTGDAVAEIVLAGIARAADGSLIAAGGDQGVMPNVVPAGGFAFGYVYFDGVDLPADATFEVEVSYEDPESNEFENERDLLIEEASLIDSRVVGVARNPTDEPLTGPARISVLCVSAEGIPTGVHGSYLDKDELDPDEEAVFQVQIFGDAGCEAFLVAGNAYAN